MRKLLSLIALLICSSVSSRAFTPRVSYGLEWGYTSTFYKSSHYNFVCAEGYRIIENPDSWRYFSNGSLLAKLGMDMTPDLNASLCSGLIGVYSRRWAVPLEMRLSYCPSGLHRDGGIFQAGGAFLIPGQGMPSPGFRALLGGGYRLALFGNFSIDLLLSLNFTLDHDLLSDPDTGGVVPSADITKNSSEYYALNLSLAVNF